MIGTALNVAAIVAGGLLGLGVARSLSRSRQVLLQRALGAFTVYVGLSMVWAGLNGRPLQILGQVLILLAAMTLGRWIGRGLGLQKRLNRAGAWARSRFQQAQQSPGQPVPDGFLAGTLRCCVGPLAILGSLQEGLLGSYRTLAIKAAMDGLATVVFARTFGWTVILSAVPVLAYQGTLTLLARFLAPFLYDWALLDSISATGGIVICCVGLVVLELLRVDLSDYLPSLVVAPVITWMFR